MLVIKVIIRANQLQRLDSTPAILCDGVEVAKSAPSVLYSLREIYICTIITSDSVVITHNQREKALAILVVVPAERLAVTTVTAHKVFLLPATEICHYPYRRIRHDPSNGLSTYNRNSCHYLQDVLGAYNGNICHYP